MKKKLIQVVAIIVAIIASWYLNYNGQNSESVSDVSQTNLLQQYYQQKVSGKMIKIQAVTEKLLADDNIRPRHQKFIVRVDGGLSVLITHNIDLADRLNQLNVGDEIVIYGQYEWNNRGGILHWTHHDPKNRRQGGWIIHQGKKYQ